MIRLEQQGFLRVAAMVVRPVCPKWGPSGAVSGTGASDPGFSTEGRLRKREVKDPALRSGRAIRVLKTDLIAVPAAHAGGGRP